MSLNKVMLIGNVGKDPEIKHLEGGITVARFPLATNETYTDKNGQRQTHTEWHNITVWRGQAEIVEKYVKQGKLLYVEGRLRTTNYDDKETGAKRYFTEIQCQSFRFLGPSSAGDQQAAKGTTQPAQEEPDLMDAPSAGVDGADDLPF